MPINFEEVSGEVVPQSASERANAPTQASPPPGQDPAECFRQQWQLHRERERRLIAD